MIINNIVGTSLMTLKYFEDFWLLSIWKSFKIISKGSKILINEFPSSEDFIDKKEQIEKI